MSSASSRRRRSPQKGSDEAAGFDLYVVEDCVLRPGQRRVLPTGVAVKVPAGCYGRIAPRSGLAVKSGIHVGAGVIDRDYRGEVGVLLMNLGDEDFVVTSSDRVAHLVLERISNPKCVEVSSLDDMSRGGKGLWQHWCQEQCRCKHRGEAVESEEAHDVPG